MKRSRLARYTPLPRSTKPLARKTRINPISKAERKRNYENAKWHDNYRAQHPDCQCGDGCGLIASDLHEIFGGSHRRACRRQRAGVLHLARSCHERCQGEPYARGLFRKLEADAEGFDLPGLLAAIGRVLTLVTIAEVLAEGEEMGKVIKSLREAESDVRHWNNKVELIRRNLADAELSQQAASAQLERARVHEQKIADARRLVKDE